jgi:hypothetical protein
VGQLHSHLVIPAVVLVTLQLPAVFHKTAMVEPLFCLLEHRNLPLVEAYPSYLAKATVVSVEMLK